MCYSTNYEHTRAGVLRTSTKQRTKEIKQYDLRKGSPRALKRKARKHPEIIISAKTRNSTPSEDNPETINPHFPSPNVQHRKGTRKTPIVRKLTYCFQ